MINTNMNKPKVKGHGSFILRDGWINKGLTELHKCGNERIFTAKNAADIFGIGTNMVSSLRYWLQCFNLVNEKTGKGTYLSELGELIYQNDRYLEDIFTLWILHSNIAKNSEKASLLHDYFNDEKIQTINKEDLLKVFVRKWSEFELPENSIKADIDVLFNMYCRTKINDDPEDKIVSPLNELNLISKDGDIYTKQQPDLRSIPDEVILYELSCLLNEEALERNLLEKRSISIDRVSNGLHSLLAIYNLSRVAVNQMLNRLEILKYIRVDRTAGLDTIYDEGIPTPIEIVKEYYAQR